MRIVRVCAEGLEQDSLNHVLWTSAPPVHTPYLCGSDILELRKLQTQSFVPASSLHIDPANGCLVAIKVYSKLGPCAGINAIQFLYDTGREQLWGCADDAASLTFFFDETERIIEVNVYKTGSIVCHVQVSRPRYMSSAKLS
jgi:hypothetical protein